MAYLTKAELLAGIALKPQDFEVDGLGVVQLRGLGLAEMSQVKAQAGDNELLLVVHGAHLGLISPQLGLEDVEALGHGNPEIVSAIGKRVFEISGMTKEADAGPLAGSGSP